MSACLYRLLLLGKWRTEGGGDRKGRMFAHHQPQLRSPLANHARRVKHLLQVDGKQLILQHFANTLTIDLHHPGEDGVLLSAKYAEIPEEHTLLFNSLLHLYQSILECSSNATLVDNSLTFSITALQQAIPVTLQLFPRKASEAEISRHQMVRLQLETALMVSRQRRYQMRADEEARQLTMAIQKERKAIAEIEATEAEMTRIVEEREAEMARMREFLGKAEKQLRELDGKGGNVVEIDDF